MGAPLRAPNGRATQVHQGPTQHDGREHAPQRSEERAERTRSEAELPSARRATATEARPTRPAEKARGKAR